MATGLNPAALKYLKAPPIFRAVLLSLKVEQKI